MNILNPRGKISEHILFQRKKNTNNSKLQKNINFKMMILIEEEINREIKDKRNILLVDDIIYTGNTLENIIKNLKSNIRDTKIATIYFNPENNKIKPDFYLYKNKDKIVFPYRLEELTLDEIRNISEEFYKILTT